MQIRSTGSYRQMLPPNSVPSIWINWFEFVVSCIAFCPQNHLEIWLCLPQPYWYCSLIAGTTTTGSLAAIPMMALSIQGFTSTSPLIVLQQQRLERLFGAAEAQSAPHLCPVGKRLLTSFTYDLGIPVSFSAVQISLLPLHLPFSFILVSGILLSCHSVFPHYMGVPAGLM